MHRHHIIVQFHVLAGAIMMSSREDAQTRSTMVKSLTQAIK